MAESFFLVFAYALRGYGGGRNNLTEAQRHRDTEEVWQNHGQQNHFFLGGVAE
jgi:hypothetical protein